MNKVAKSLCAAALLLMVASCSKERTGRCYCHYYSGNKIYHDLSMLSNEQQDDSCAVMDANAAAFGGECEIEKD